MLLWRIIVTQDANARARSARLDPRWIADATGVFTVGVRLIQRPAAAVLELVIGTRIVLADADTIDVAVRDYSRTD